VSKVKKSIGEQIIDALARISDFPLPDYGVVGGQAVAEIYFRLKSIPIETRVKDIDLFINLKKYKTSDKILTIYKVL